MSAGQEQGGGAILFDAPLTVMVQRAKLLAEYRGRIRQDLVDISAEFPNREYFDVATNAYANRIGSEIPDRVIQSSVKKLVAVEIAATKAQPIAEKSI